MSARYACGVRWQGNFRETGGRAHFRETGGRAHFRGRADALAAFYGGLAAESGSERMILGTFPAPGGAVKAANALTITPVATKEDNSRIYRIYHESGTRMQAETYCEQLGSHLVTITSSNGGTVTAIVLYNDSTAPKASALTAAQKPDL